MATKKSDNETAVVEQKVAPKRVMLGQREWTYDLFKLQDANELYNTAPSRFAARLVERPHHHYFRTLNKKGEPETKCAHRAGHSHEVHVSVDDQGNFVAKCGPAFREVMQKTEFGHKRMRVSPRYKHENGVTEDDHTHEVVYVGSKTFSEAGTMAQAQVDSNRVNQLQATKK